MEELPTLVEAPVFDFTHEINPGSHIALSKLPFLSFVAQEGKTPTTKGNLALLNCFETVSKRRDEFRFIAARSKVYAPMGVTQDRDRQLAGGGSDFGRHSYNPFN